MQLSRQSVGFGKLNEITAMSRERLNDGFEEKNQPLDRREAMAMRLALGGRISNHSVMDCERTDLGKLMMTMVIRNRGNTVAGLV